MDWPLTLKDLEPYYARAEDKMGVTRTNGIPGLPGNNNFKVMYAGAKKLGYKEVHTGNMAINSQPRDDRGRCMQLGFCFQGCKSGAKWSTLYTELPKAEKTGNMDLRPESHVSRIEHDEAGKVTGVVYFDKAGKEQRQKARIVCVAGNSIETPRLLLLSASTMFKDGLANSSGQVGRNYMRHMTGSVYAAFKNPVHMYRGTTMAGIIRDEARARHQARLCRRLRDGDAVAGRALHGRLPRTRAAGARTSPGGWTTTPTWPACGWSARTCRARRNRVTLNANVKDKWGNAAPNVHFDDHDNDIAMRNHAFTQGEQVYQAAGAIRTFRTPPYPSTHNLGTCRMGASAQGQRVQRLRPDARHQQPVHLRRQPVHHRRRREPDPDHRDAGDPPGRLHRQADERACDLSAP